MAIRSFRDAASEDIARARRTKAALRRLPPNLHERTRVKLARLAAATSIFDLSSLPGNRLEKLRGDRAEQHSIRINEQYRICFVWREPDAYDVEVVDYHS